MSFTEARAICSQLVWRKYDDNLYKSAQKKLAGELISASPRVNCAEPGIFFLDAEGLGRLGGENKLCRDLLKLVSRHGFLDGRVGIASSAFAARVASGINRRRWHIVPAAGADKESSTKELSTKESSKTESSNSDARFLAPLSISLLPVSLEARQNLEQLGLKTIGQMVDLPESSYRGRFEADVLHAYHLACGIDPTFCNLPRMEKHYQCFFDIGSAMDSLKETLFVLKNMLDRLTSEIKLDGLMAEELTIQFLNDGELFDNRVIRLIRPSNTSKFLLDVLRLSLEAKPLMREYTAINLAVSQCTKESFEQGSIIESLDEGGVDENSEAVMLLLQKFMTRLGEDVLVRPVENDQYLPENAGVWQPLLQGFSPMNSEFSNQYSMQPRKGSLMPGLVLKRHTPAMPVFVQFSERSSERFSERSSERERSDKEEPKPTAITYKGQWYYVSRITAPERISGMWWEEPVRKSYYVALLERRELSFSGRALREVKGQSKGQAKIQSILPALITVLLVFDHEEASWLVEGVFD